MYAKLTNETRKKVYRRDGWQCAMCGSHRYLQIHHCIPRGEGGTNSLHNLITLCSDCHALAHGFNVLDYPDFSQESICQSIVEYLADEYAPDWDPWGE